MAELDHYIDDASKQPPADLESAVRLACLATIKGKNKIAKEILLEASEEHRHRAKLARKRASSRTPVRSGLGALYSVALELCEAEQETGIANQFERLRRRWDTLAKEILELWEEDHRTPR